MGSLWFTNEIRVVFVIEITLLSFPGLISVEEPADLDVRSLRILLFQVLKIFMLLTWVSLDG